MIPASANDAIVTNSIEVRVVAQCPYVRRWIHKRPEYQDLLTRGR
jgi:predicted GNAT family acetyltransferase